MRNKIFIYIHSLSIGGGAENVCVRVAEAYVKAGLEVIVCALTDELPSFEERLVKNKIRVIRLQGKVLALFELLKKEQPQVLSCWLYPCIISGAILGRLAGVPEIIVNLRGPDLKKSPLKVLVDFLCRPLYTGVVAVSTSVRDIFVQREKYPANKITIIPNGQEYPERLPFADQAEARRVLGLPKTAFLIGCIGRLYVEKNQRFVLEVLPKILPKVPQARLVLVGDGPETDTLRQRVKALGLSAQVIFAGWQKEVYGYLQALDVCVLPSKYEGHPGTVLQAWYAQVPILGAKVTGIRDLIVDGKNGLLFSLSAPQQLSNLLINAALHPEYFKPLVTEGYTQATTEYTLPVMQAAHVAYMQERCLTYSIYTSWDQLASCAAAWDSLNNNPFQTFGQTKYWQEQFAPDKKLYVVVISDLSGVVGIAPLYRVGNLVAFLGEGRMNYLGVIGRTCGLLDFLKKQGVRSFVFANVRADNSFAKELAGFTILKTRPCPYVEIEAGLSWDKYLASVLKNKRRYEIRTGEEALRSKGEVRLITRRGGEVAAEEFTAIQALYLKRWSGSYRETYLRKEKKYFAYQKFLMQSPEAYISLLYVGEVLVSFMFGFIKQKSFVDYWVAHDSSYADCSVGNVHVGLVIKDMQAKGLSLFDFSIGEEVYKRKWAKQDVLIQDYYLGWGLYYCLRYVKQLLREQLRALLR